jgi:formiminotetrahydrofolate cyclodeaminase
MALTSLSLNDFLDRLASSAPTPGGGSVAAAVGAFGAGLVSMVAHLTMNSPKHAAASQECRRIADAAQELCRELARLVDEDARSFDRVSIAYRLPKATAEEKATRSEAIQEALLGAILPPVAVIERARALCSFAGQLADIGNPNAPSDIGCAALCAQAAAQCAKLNVEINAAALKDRLLAERYRTQTITDAAQVNLLCEVVLDKLRAMTHA